MGQQAQSVPCHSSQQRHVNTAGRQGTCCMRASARRNASLDTYSSGWCSSFSTCTYPHSIGVTTIQWNVIDRKVLPVEDMTYVLGVSQNAPLALHTYAVDTVDHLCHAVIRQEVLGEVVAVVQVHQRLQLHRCHPVISCLPW